jgi:hypothetical protein
MKIKEYSKGFENEEIFQLIHYELVCKIYPEILLFKSEQKIAIKNISSKSVVKVDGLVLKRLSVDSLIMKGLTDHKSLIKNGLLLNSKINVFAAKGLGVSVSTYRNFNG